MAITKAGRILSGLFTKDIPDEMLVVAKDQKKREALWRGISDGEFAKELLNAWLEVEERTYEELCGIVLGDLSNITGEELKSRLRGLQGRLIAGRTLLQMFIPNFDPESIKKEE